MIGGLGAALVFTEGCTRCGVTGNTTQVVVYGLGSICGSTLAAVNLCGRCWREANKVMSCSHGEKYASMAYPQSTELCRECWEKLTIRLGWKGDRDELVAEK